MEMKMAPAVRERVAPSLSSGKLRADAVSKRVKTTAPFKNIVIAQRKETRTKKRWTLGRARSSGVRGQKSWVKR
jgi:hypothetical protein